MLRCTVMVWNIIISVAGSKVWTSGCRTRSVNA